MVQREKLTIGLIKISHIRLIFSELDIERKYSFPIGKSIGFQLIFFRCDVNGYIPSSMMNAAQYSGLANGCEPSSAV